MTAPSPSYIDGPQWAHGGLIESGGLYPLRVEPPVSVLVEMLLPGIITTTTQPRYYALHAIAWDAAADEGLDLEAARELVRRTEVVLAAIYRACGGPDGHDHRRRVPAAHGAGTLARFTDGRGSVDLRAASANGGMSSGGFWSTYLGVEQATRLVAPGAPPTAGDRLDREELRETFGPILRLARADRLEAHDIDVHVDLCPCRTAESADGAVLRRVLIHDAGDENGWRRQMTCRMMLEALDESPSSDPEFAFSMAHGYGPAIQRDDREAVHRATWRAAILRNHSVSAWRRLWARISEHLADERMTRTDLVDRIAAEAGEGRVRDLVHGLPAHSAGLVVLPAERTILERDGDHTVRRDLEVLAVGALRAGDLDDVTRRPFLGHRRFRGELDPEWVARHLELHADHSVEALVHQVVGVLLDRAARVAHSKMTMVDGRPYAPTRLRDRDGLLWMTEAEGHQPVSLRGWTLAQVLCGLGVLDRDRESGVYRVTERGRETHDALRV